MLYIVGTPIGNLQDITLRSLEVLKKVDYIISEHPKDTLRLLNFYNIKKKIYPFHNNSNHKKVLDNLKKSKDIALVSSAGMPLISDPGQSLVKELIDNNLEYQVIPGPAAFSTALIKVGLSLNNSYFVGFLYKKKGKKLKQLQYLYNVKAKIIIYESKYRIKDTLNLIKQVFCNSPIYIVKELTKLYESYIFSQKCKDLDVNTSFLNKGEFVIILLNE